MTHEQRGNLKNPDFRCQIRVCLSGNSLMGTQRMGIDSCECFSPLIPAHDGVTASRSSHQITGMKIH